MNDKGSVSVDEVERQLSEIISKDVVPVKRVDANSGSQQIVEQINSTCSKVHDHTIEILDQLSSRIEDLKHRVSDKRQQMAEYTSEYVNLADGALKAAEHIGVAVESLQRHLEGDRGKK